jgi:Ca2+-binding RTX toxin-like protein
MLVGAVAAVAAPTASAMRIGGTPSDDVITGSARHDLIFAWAGNDTVTAGSGPDRVIGGPGNDDLWALAQADAAPDAPGVDHLLGEEGRDTLRTRDGEPDVVNCGPGSDKALLDTVDVIEDATAENPNGSCEVVQRDRPNRADSRQEDATEEPAEDKKTE